MASEYRFVIFSWRDVRGALVAYDRRRGLSTPTTPADLFEIDPDTLGCALSFGAPPDRKRFVYDKDSVAAALAMRCHDVGVALPPRAARDLHLIEGRLALSAHVAGPVEPEALTLEILSEAAA